MSQPAPGAESPTGHASRLLLEGVTAAGWWVGGNCVPQSCTLASVPELGTGVGPLPGPGTKLGPLGSPPGLCRPSQELPLLGKDSVSCCS